MKKIIPKFIFIYKIILVGFILFCFLFQVSSCKAQDNEIKEFFNIDKKADLIFFYTKESTEDERRYFDHNILMKKMPDGGHWTRDGVGVVFSAANGEYKGSGINFSPDATEEQKADIKRRLEESPIVYKVFEDVVESEIILNPADAVEADKKKEERKKDNRPPKTISIKPSNDNQ